MKKEQLKMLVEIQALDFTALDLNLFLDTHPDDQRAFRNFSETVRKSENMKRNYIEKYGPLIATDTATQNSWNWIDSPWPWEIDY